MRQHIDTAPVWAVYRDPAACECPLCALERRAEQDYVESFLGGSVMEPAMRIEVNQKGFCARHFALLYDAGNRLGVALMADTYLKEIILRIRERKPAAPRTLFGKKSAPAPAPTFSSTCILCDRLNATMTRYAETLCYMWESEPDFRRAFDASKGVCLKHYELLASASRDAAFSDALITVTLSGLDRVERDLAWFTQKFDYRNQDKPWGDSRDAVERALNKLRGECVSHSVP